VELRALVERGESPARSKQAAAVAQRVVDERRVTFRAFAQRWIEETLFYRSVGYLLQTVRWLDTYVNPAIGDMAVGEVQPGDVLAIIKSRVHNPEPRDPQPALLQAHRFRCAGLQPVRVTGHRGDVAARAWIRALGGSGRGPERRGERGAAASSLSGRP
jgi:hypothetical protein